MHLFPRLRSARAKHYLWAANPHVLRAYWSNRSTIDPRVTVAPNAVWIKDELMTFYLSARDENKTPEQLRKDFPCKEWDRNGNAHGSSTLLSPGMNENVGKYKPGVISGTQGMGVTVEARDFAAWMMSLRLCEAEGKDYVVVKVDVEGVEYMLLERIMELGPRVFCIADHWPIEFHHTTKKKMAWHNRDNSTSGVVDRFGAMLKTCPKKVGYDTGW